MLPEGASENSNTTRDGTVPRHPPMGPCVMISESWYKSWCNSAPGFLQQESRFRSEGFFRCIILADRAKTGCDVAAWRAKFRDLFCSARSQAAKFGQRLVCRRVFA